MFYFPYLPLDKNLTIGYYKYIGQQITKKENDMTTINITTRKNNKMQLTGDMLSGDTFAVKDYIKSYLDGKWDGNAKAWRVNVSKINTLLHTPGAQISIDDGPVVEKKSAGSNGWCNKCHSYCYGDCDAN
jgi:hypothetical protein